MKKTFYSRLMLGMLVMATGLAFTACNSDDDPKIDEGLTTPSGKEMVFDDALYFEQNFVTKNPNGDNVYTSVGRILDENDPMTIYVGAESAEDAKNIFLSWLTPGSEGRIRENANGDITYLPQSWEGKSQGEITYEPNDDGYKFGSVTLSSDVPISSFKKIVIIRYTGFPDNSFNSGIMSIEANKIGAKATFTTNYYPKGSVGFVIREKEPDKGIPGKVIFVFKDKFSSDTDIMPSCPTLDELSAMDINFGYLKLVYNFDIYAEYKKLGVEFSCKTVFWSRNWEWKGWWLFQHVCFWSCDLAGNHKDWWDTQKTSPHKERALITFTF